MKIKATLLLMACVFCGCAKSPHQSGIWTGVVERRTFYTAKGRDREALVLKIEDGPRMGDPSFRGLAAPPRERDQFYYDVPILVDKDLQTFNFYELEGKRAKVSGTIQYGPARDSFDMAEITRLTKFRDATRNTVSPLVLKTKKSLIQVIPSKTP